MLKSCDIDANNRINKCDDTWDEFQENFENDDSFLSNSGEFSLLLKVKHSRKHNKQGSKLQVNNFAYFCRLRMKTIE